MTYAQKISCILGWLCIHSLHALSGEQAYLQLAQSLKDEGNTQEAIIHYKNTLARNAKNQDALYELGLLFYNNGNPEGAAQQFEQFLQLKPDHFDASLHLGASYAVLNNLEKAIQLYTNALRINPSSAKTHFCLGIAHKKLRNYEKAIIAFSKALEVDQKYFDAWYNLAQVYRDSNQIPQAIQTLDQALTLQPTNNNLLFEKANTLTNFGYTTDALTIYNSLIAKSPNNPTLLTNCAFALKKQGDYQQAIELYRKVLEHQPTNSNAHLGSSYAYLALGDFDNGFKELALSSSANTNRLLTNKDQIKDRIIFISGHWCFEDVIQFIRYAALIKQHGGQVVAQINGALIGLLKQCPFIDTIVSVDDPKPTPYHIHIPMISMPALFTTNTETIPATVPYISAPPELVEQWKEKLHNDHNLKIGLHWNHDDAMAPLAENKNIALKQFIPLSSLKNISIYSLQTLITEQLAELPYSCIINQCGSGFKDNEASLSQVAALMQNLDLIITRDSLIAHIAGAMGKQVFVALPYRAEWRWMENRSDSPWYPTMKLFRQQTPGEWDSVIEDMITTITSRQL